jgi:hypothetical protein
MMNIKQPYGPPMTLGNMRELGVHHLIAYLTPAGIRH